MRGLVALLLLGAVAVAPPVRREIRNRWTAWRVRLDPDEAYRLAERHYQAGDYEKASLCCERVLRATPAHAPARALFTEVQFILGSATPQTDIDGSPHMQRTLSYTRLWIEMDAALDRAERLLQARDSAAEKEFRKVLEYAKWLPTGLETQARANRARDGLRRCAGP